MPEFTPIQKAILKVLDDGYAHKREELREALADELSEVACVNNHLSNLRKKLRPIGQDIVCELQSRKICYRWVRLL